MRDNCTHRSPNRPQIAIALVQGHQVNRRYSTAIPDKALLPAAQKLKFRRLLASDELD